MSEVLPYPFFLSIFVEARGATDWLAGPVFYSVSIFRFGFLPCFSFFFCPGGNNSAASRGSVGGDASGDCDVAAGAGDGVGTGAAAFCGGGDGHVASDSAGAAFCCWWRLWLVVLVVLVSVLYPPCQEERTCLERDYAQLVARQQVGD